MVLKKSWVGFGVLLAALGMAGLSCGKSDSEKSSQSPTPTETARPEVPAPGAPGAPPPGASSAPNPDTSGTSSSAMPKEATGEVVSANPMMKTLVVRANGNQISFVVKESAAGDLAKIKPGDRVTIQYMEDGGKNTAEAIREG